MRRSRAGLGALGLNVLLPLARAAFDGAAAPLRLDELLADAGGALIVGIGRTGILRPLRPGGRGERRRAESARSLHRARGRRRGACRARSTRRTRTPRTFPSARGRSSPFSASAGRRVWADRARSGCRFIHASVPGGPTARSSSSNRALLPAPPPGDGCAGCDAPCVAACPAGAVARGGFELGGLPCAPSAPPSRAACRATPESPACAAPSTATVTRSWRFTCGRRCRAVPRRLDAAPPGSYPRPAMAITVNAHITGTVWKINVKVGDAVAEGETVAILESMKMEMPVESPSAGTVTAVLAKEGASIEEGAPLRRADAGLDRRHAQLCSASAAWADSRTASFNETCTPAARQRRQRKQADADVPERLDAVEHDGVGHSAGVDDGDRHDRRSAPS